MIFPCIACGKKFQRTTREHRVFCNDRCRMKYRARAGAEDKTLNRFCIEISKLKKKHTVEANLLLEELTTNLLKYRQMKKRLNLYEKNMKPEKLLLLLKERGDDDE